MSPPYSTDFELSYDPGIEQMVLFGGYGNVDGNAVKNDVDLQRSDVDPASAGDESNLQRVRLPLSYDSALNEMILLTESGSGSPTSAMENWAYDGTNWALLDTLSGPSKRILAVMANDPASNQLVLFGGFSNSTGFTAGDTWRADVDASSPARLLVGRIRWRSLYLRSGPVPRLDGAAWCCSDLPSA